MRASPAHLPRISRGRYASLLGSMSGHQLSGFTHHGSLQHSLQHTHSGQALDLVESDSDEEYMYTVGNGDGLHSADESDEESSEDEGDAWRELLRPGGPVAEAANAERAKRQRRTYD